MDACRARHNRSSRRAFANSRRILVAAAALACAGAASATHLTTPPSASKPTVAWGFNDDWGWRKAEFHPRLADRQLRYAGHVMPDELSADRFHVQWATAEPRRGHFRWGRTDRVYAAMRQYAAHPIMVLYNAPWWARDPHARCHADADCAYPPRVKRLDEWRRFVRRATARYPDVRAIEVWNEPNLARFWAPRADPQRYARLLAAAHDAATAAGATAPVISGGLIPIEHGRRNMDPAEFLWRVYNVAGAAAFDGIGSHPYPRQAPYVDNMWVALDALRAVRAANDDASTPLWITEVGVSTHAPGGVGVDEQGGVLVDLYRSIEGHDVRSFVIHRFQVGAEGGYWNGTAVVGNHFAQKPAFCELGAAIGIPCEEYFSG